MGKRYSDAVPDIPPAAVDALCDEIRRIKKTHSYGAAAQSARRAKYFRKKIKNLELQKAGSIL